MAVAILYLALIEFVVLFCGGLNMKLLKKMSVLTVALMFTACMKPAGESQTASESDQVKESFPKVVSCYMALDFESKGFSCNEFTVKDESEKKLVATTCKLAESASGLEVKMENEECDRIKVKSLCHDVDDFNNPLKTFFYYTSDDMKDAAKDSCDKLKGSFEDISSLAITK